MIILEAKIITVTQKVSPKITQLMLDVKMINKYKTLQKLDNGNKLTF